MRNVFLCAALVLVGCSGSGTESRSPASAASSGGGGAAGEGGAGGCEPCSALHLCVVSCHPAGTPLDFCQACDGGGGAK